MLACKLGCDDLYELGYLAVASTGCIVTIRNEGNGGPVDEYLDQLRGTVSPAFSEANASYFEWHREHIFLGNAGSMVVN